MEEGIRFGPSGNSQSFYDEGHRSTWEAPKWIAQRGLTAFEYSFGRGVRLSYDAGARIRREAEAHRILLSVHLPYYINLATDTPDKQDKNLVYFLQGLKAADSMGAKRAVFHPGSAAKIGRDTALSWAKTLLGRVLMEQRSAGLSHIALCPETMGKINQLGSLSEVIALCRVDETLIPCLDFGHLYCRALGGLTREEEFAAILDELEQGVGMERARRMHVHFSRIEFGAGGEKLHLTFADERFGPPFEPLAEELIKRRYAPVIICESAGTMAEDAMTMLGIYQNRADQGKDLP